jgi:hypothetical protein
MIELDELHKKWMGDAGYRREYEALEEEFALASAMIRARTRAGLARRISPKEMATSESAIARMESGRAFFPGAMCEV